MLCLFFFNDTATTEIYTLSLHDALPISEHRPEHHPPHVEDAAERLLPEVARGQVVLGPLDDAVLPVEVPHGDRKSTRLNSSHANISYAVFCLKKKKQSTLHPSHCFRINH